MLYEGRRSKVDIHQIPGMYLHERFYLYLRLLRNVYSRVCIELSLWATRPLTSLSPQCVYVLLLGCRVHLDCPYSRNSKIKSPFFQFTYWYIMAVKGDDEK